MDSESKHPSQRTVVNLTSLRSRCLYKDTARVPSIARTHHAIKRMVNVATTGACTQQYFRETRGMLRDVAQCMPAVVHKLGYKLRWSSKQDAGGHAQ